MPNGQQEGIRLPVVIAAVVGGAVGGAVGGYLGAQAGADDDNGGTASIQQEQPQAPAENPPA